MKRIAAIAALLTIGACESFPRTTSNMPDYYDTGQIMVSGAEAKIAHYYAGIPDSALPATSLGKPLPAASTALTRILVASCNNEEIASPALARLARERADLLLMTGDNVYGDMNGRQYINNDPDLMELRESFTELGQQADLRAARAAHPMMVSWDDHDYGGNDAGADFPFRLLAERVHEKFWGLDTTEAGDRAGTYYARSFGPEGQRTQIIMLDTRFFRSPLKVTDDWGAPGKQRYVPQTSETQEMLGAEQWAWLEAELRKPADLRLLVSSIQVIPDAHGWEAWDKLPAERQRLYDVINETSAKGVILLSGDRHTSFLYRKSGVTAQPLYVLTASSLNLSFSDESDEMDSAQLGAGYAKTNYGSVEIDWARSEAKLAIHSETGQLVRQATARFR